MDEASTQLGSDEPRSHAAPPVSFGEAIRRGLLDWRCRVRGSRSEYWWLALFCFLATLALRSALGPRDKSPVTVIVAAFLSVIMFKALVRRYHDVGLSVWWALLNYLVGYIALVLMVIGISSVVVSALGAGMTARAKDWLHAGVAGFVIGVANGVWTLILLCRKGEEGINRWG